MMKLSFWTPERDASLKNWEGQGLSASQIAVKLGTTRNAVLGRSHRLRGTVFKSQVSRKEAERAKRFGEQVAHSAHVVSLLEKLDAELKDGVSRTEAVAKAHDDGATLQAIGDHLGLTRERVRQICNLAKRRRVQLRA